MDRHVLTTAADVTGEDEITLTLRQRDNTGATTLDRSKWRADTPACEHLVHLNNAGTGLPPKVVTERVVSHLRLEEQVGGYEAADRIVPEWEAGRESLARLVGGSAEGIAIVESTTAALHKILATVPLRRGDRVLVAGAEYASTLLPLMQLARRTGLQLEVLPDDENGVVDLATLAATLRDDVRMVLAVHAPSHNGLVNDVAGVGEVLRAADSHAWFVVDACQSLGQLPVDVTTIGCDFLMASGRKYLRGPRGTGILHASQRALQELDAYPLDIQGAQLTSELEFVIDPTAVRFESWERSIAAGLGLMAAANYTLATEMSSITTAIGRNAEYLRSNLGALRGWRVLDRGNRRSGIVVARHRSVAPEEMVPALRQQRVNLHVVPASSSPRDLGGESALRLSPHAFNNQADLDRALGLLADLTE